MHELNIYGALFLIGIVASAWLWGRMTRRPGSPHDGRLVIIYFAGLFGALIGAKLAFLLAEGWHHRADWLALITGRSVTGALLAGYAAVEIAKWKLRYRHATGDVFAVIVPLALGLGRIGCLVQGCCAGEVCEESAWYAWHDAEGVARWPSQLFELGFNLAFALWALCAMRFDWQRGNRFHIYLIGYGLFRFAHEFLRERIEIVGELGGYHLLAIAIFALGLLRYVQRRRTTIIRASLPPTDAAAGHRA